MHRAEDLIKLFERCFAAEFNTALEGGASEPLYRPASAVDERHRIFFTRDYFASALHEVAHWCVAGTERRSQVDYGYWYAPDGRNAQQQRLFERVEVKPQALEWLFAEACGVKFHVSVDNLEVGGGPSPAFKRSIIGQCQAYCHRGLPARANRFAHALAHFYGVHEPFDSTRYTWERLD